MKKRETMLDRAINGREVIAKVSGQYAPRTKCSNLYHAIVDAGYTPADIGSKIDIAIGAKNQRRSEGFLMAIVRI